MKRKIKVALTDVDGHNFPNLCLMKLSAWYKAKGDTVEWWDGFGHYDRLYMSKVFTEEYSPDELEPVNVAEIITEEERRNLTCGSGGRSNPALMEWLMGFPIGWTG